MNRAVDRPPDRELRSFGRRRGRGLSTRQHDLLRNVLPRVQLDLADPAPAQIGTLFPTAVEKVWLEVGFGGAEHLVWQSRQNPRAGIIGCEPFEDGIVKAIDAIETEKLDNILVHPDDARPVLRWLPSGGLDRVFILFPDPWPKKRHVKRRLVTGTLLEELARVMRPGGELRLATDVGDYARDILLGAGDGGRFRWLAECAQNWRERPADWPQTRYEAKAAAKGRRRYFLRLIRL